MRGDLPEPDREFLVSVLRDGSGTIFKAAPSGVGRMVISAAAAPEAN